MGLAPLMLFTTTMLIVRNQRILDAWNARQAENARRAAAGLPPENPPPPQDPRQPHHSAAIAPPRTRTPAPSTTITGSCGSSRRLAHATTRLTRAAMACDWPRTKAV